MNIDKNFDEKFIFHLIRDKTIALKDQDFLEDQAKIVLTKGDAKMLRNAMEADCKFFKENKIIDYSLLFGIHFIPKGYKKKKLVQNFK